MNDLQDNYAVDSLIGPRQCSAHNRSGERCGRAPLPGGTVCNLHGGRIPQVQAAAKLRLLALVEPALDVLYRATRNAPPCEHCGRSDADRDPTAIRAAQIILDRAGYHPTLTLESAAPNPFANYTEDALIEKLDAMLTAAKQRRAERLAISTSIDDDDVYIDEEDDDQPPIQKPDEQFPSGKNHLNEGERK